MDECVITCLSKIKKATSWRNDKDLRDTIDNICAEIKDERKRLKKRGAEYKDTDADKYWGCLRSALDNKSPGVKGAAMEAICTLIQEGYLTGEAEPLEPHVDRDDFTMMEQIAESLCAQKDVEDDTMKQSLARSIAEVVKMGTVNGEYLLKAIDVCYKVYMEATSGATREAAEEALKEIMAFLMQSMDYVDKTKDAEVINSNVPLTPTPFNNEEEDEEEGVQARLPQRVPVRGRGDADGLQVRRRRAGLEPGDGGGGRGGGGVRRAEAGLAAVAAPPRHLPGVPQAVLDREHGGPGGPRGRWRGV